MAGNLGLWIDHGKAFLVEFNGKGEVRRKLVSEVEPHHRFHGGAHSAKGFGSLEAASESRAERRRANQLKTWYKEVLEAVSDSDPSRILIIGPGEAKTEFMHEVEKVGQLAKKVVGMESVDHLTENQIAAMVRKYFDPEASNGVPPYRRPPGA